MMMRMKHAELEDLRTDLASLRRRAEQVMEGTLPGERAPSIPAPADWILTALGMSSPTIGVAMGLPSSTPHTSSSARTTQEAVGGN